MEGKFIVILALIASLGRIVNLASVAALMALNEMSDDLKLQFKNPQISLQELHDLMSFFVE